MTAKHQPPPDQNIRIQYPCSVPSQVWTHTRRRMPSSGGGVTQSRLRGIRRLLRGRLLLDHDGQIDKRPVAQFHVFGELGQVAIAHVNRRVGPVSPNDVELVAPPLNDLAQLILVSNDQL